MSGALVRIDRCVCKAVSFRELLEMAQVLGEDIELLALSTGASIECGSCRPWLARALETGEDCFAIPAGELPDGERLLAHFGSGECP